MKFPRILVLDLEISEGCNNFVQFLGSSFVLSKIFRGKLKTPKIPGKFSKKYVLNYFGNLGWDRRPIKKTFWSGADVPLPEETIKVENNWESTNNLKLWILNISRLSTLQKL